MCFGLSSLFRIGRAKLQVREGRLPFMGSMSYEMHEQNSSSPQLMNGMDLSHLPAHSLQSPRRPFCNCSVVMLNDNNKQMVRVEVVS